MSYWIILCLNRINYKLIILLINVYNVYLLMYTRLFLNHYYIFLINKIVVQQRKNLLQADFILILKIEKYT